MKRRQFIALIGGAVAAAPLATRAEQAMPVVGFLNTAWPKEYPALVHFHRGLAESGYVDGRNVRMEYRWADGDTTRIPILAADLIRRRVDVIFTSGSPAALAARAATSSIPIVFSIGIDPVQAGLVESMGRPGRNLTGVTNLAIEVAPKRLELLRELLPQVKAVGALVNPARATAAAEARDFEAASTRLGFKVHILNASNDAEIDKAFATLVQLQGGAIAIGGDSFFNGRSERLARLATQHKLPAVYQFQDFVQHGGLMSYGSSATDNVRLAGNYVGRVLRGEKPAELPVQQSAKVELFINLKTAKAFGLSVPTALLVRADEVIE